MKGLLALLEHYYQIELAVEESLIVLFHHLVVLTLKIDLIIDNIDALIVIRG
jgi:hypothetical protein